MSTKIKDIPYNNRPRERLINNGVTNLSDEELLAIILNTGTSNLSAKELALNILKEINDLNDISLERLMTIKGIGYAKACKVLASIELGKRLNNKVPNINGLAITNPKIIFEHYKPILRHHQQEEFIVIYLNNKQQIIKDKLLFIGTINRSIASTREIFKYAYELNASFIICIHNHPSGNPLPSKEDLNTTNEIKKTGEILKIPLIDHIIIGKNNYYSLAENNDM